MAILPIPTGTPGTQQEGAMDAGRQGSSSFGTVRRERIFRHPSKTASDNPAIHKLVAPHIESFDALFQAPDGGGGLLALCVQSLPAKVVFDGKGDGGRGNRIEFRVEEVLVANPMESGKHARLHDRTYPSECREKLATYGGTISAKISWSVNGGPPSSELRDLGKLPIMVKSAKCNLRGCSPAELTSRHEESEEMGGYFIINGNERIIRFLIVPRRNHVIGLFRTSFTARGSFYTPHACQIRSVRPDQSSQTNTLHYLGNGNITFRFSWRKNEYMVPVVMLLKALLDVSDKEIFCALARDNHHDTFRTDRIELLLRGFKAFALPTGAQCLQFLGDKFRVVLGCPEDWDNTQVGRHLLARVVLVHLGAERDKFDLLIFMIQKLYALVGGDCCVDNPDSPQHQEVLMPGHVLAMILKERLEEVLVSVRSHVLQELRRSPQTVDFFDSKFVLRALQRADSDVGRKVNFFLATGNLVSPTGLDLQQVSGFTIIAEKLNFYRYISHFRCIHRGAFFAELKTTAVRKLLPEAWGFLCPVHTPDGSPCGLLNHLAHSCRLTTVDPDVGHLPQLLASLGMDQTYDRFSQASSCQTIQLDGRIIGSASPALCSAIATSLRVWKTESSHRVPLDLEIGLVPASKGGQYPGLYLFSTRGRMMRPVKLLANGLPDHVGPFEQVYLGIACGADEVVPGVTTHAEVSPTHVLSLLANLTPFSDCNQSPRNMYQCQMSKQTMGTPSTALPHRTDNKLYRLHTGQTPVVRPSLHDAYDMDHFPNGTNAVVAVISYTGYDMEDAMILNKSAHERGFGNGTIYKSHIVDLQDGSSRGSTNKTLGVGRDLAASGLNLDADGVVPVGSKVKPGDPLCAFVDGTTGKTHLDKYKGDEVAFVDEVRAIAGDNKEAPCTKLHFKLRVPRPPVIGDKFSSRHGQKGVCSQKWPAVDMPFSESGMQPDVIINPHAFPSRMTIGMFVESLAGKAGALHGQAQDATPFRFGEANSPADHFGQQLLRAGFSFHGNEPMYSGVTGEEFPADIYLGVVYYQRLRHMVGDKWQVRTLGKVDQQTRQPVKGRKRGGGIRFGEMERDALLAHGTAFLLQDRLMNCSDYSTAYACRRCGSLVSLGFGGDAAVSEVSIGDGRTLSSEEYCRVCQLSTGSEVDVVAVPYVFRYLACELMAMGIKVALALEP